MKRTNHNVKNKARRGDSYYHCQFEEAEGQWPTERDRPKSLNIPLRNLTGISTLVKLDKFLDL